MARRPRVLFEGAIYHVTFRGNAKQNIFTAVVDRKKLLEKLAECQEIYQTKILLYCLMPNHVHLLVETPLANLNRFMGTLLTGYTVYYNLRHNRSGHLLQGRYGAQLVSGDDYLLKLSRYIHLNPVHTDYWINQPLVEKISFLRQFTWSSYRSYLGLNQNDSWLNMTPLMKLIPTKPGANESEAYLQFVESGLTEPDATFRAQIKQNSLAVGPDHFIQEMKARYAETIGSRVKSEDAILRHEKSLRSPEDVLSAVRKITGMDDITRVRRAVGGPERAFLAKAWLTYTGRTQREIAENLSLTTGAAVSALIKRHADNPSVATWSQNLILYLKG
jgi:REP element-mobilizing transposase RayT